MFKIRLFQYIQNDANKRHTKRYVNYNSYIVQLAVYLFGISVSILCFLVELVYGYLLKMK